ncbi:hypothetical protein QCE63_32055 [Caballeronia sp. LZ065]|uniref:gp53-like domain-containing protein n=1 Tax=Caballeronia sp. LZ065 TaxID=3038571 RepID=UPI0028558CAA|nr:hypothetical protein [Caballeronia sp. LZ065]MDR5784055.1 hypothetical protein [Caballeronia sp. LZ065]
MFRIDDATAATSLPTPEAAGTEGYFTEGNPTSGTPATNVRGAWLNMIQEELRAVVVAGGLTPSKTTYNQVYQALQALFPLKSLFAAVLSTNGYLKIPTPAGTLFIQWGTANGASGTWTFPIAFPTAVARVFVNNADTGATYATTSVWSLSSAGFYRWNSSGAAVSGNTSLLAIGY